MNTATFHTINQARSIIRHAKTPEKIKSFFSHLDPNVVRSAKFMIAFRGYDSNTPEIPFEEASKSFKEIDELAMKYGIAVSEVNRLVAEKGSLLSAKRSLAARKGAATKKAAAV